MSGGASICRGDEISGGQMAFCNLKFQLFSYLKIDNSHFEIMTIYNSTYLHIFTPRPGIQFHPGNLVLKFLLVLRDHSHSMYASWCGRGEEGVTTHTNMYTHYKNE